MNLDTTPFTASTLEEKLENSLELDIQVEIVESSNTKGEQITAHTLTTCALC